MPEGERFLTMNSKRFVPFAAVLLLLLACGGRLPALETETPLRLILAASYITFGLILIIIRGRVAALWSTSTLLPLGCALLLVLAGLSVLSRAERPRTAPGTKNSAGVSAPRTQAAFRLAGRRPVSQL